MIWPSKKLNRLEKISEACEQYQIHFIIVDPELADICPDLTNPDKLGEDFIHMPVNGAAKGSKSDQIFILGYVPHLKSASILKQN